MALRQWETRPITNSDGGNRPSLQVTHPRSPLCNRRSQHRPQSSRARYQRLTNKVGSEIPSGRRCLRRCATWNKGRPSVPRHGAQHGGSPRGQRSSRRTPTIQHPLLTLQLRNRRAGSNSSSSVVTVHRLKRRFPIPARLARRTAHSRSS